MRVTVSYTPGPVIVAPPCGAAPPAVPTLTLMVAQPIAFTLRLLPAGVVGAIAEPPVTAQ